jgi:leucine dehydrogenase
VIMIPAGETVTGKQRRDALLDFGDTVQMLRGHYITAEDVGTSSRDMTLISSRTRWVAGLARARGGSGDPSPFTALGVETAIRACCERAFGSDSLRGRSVCVVGLGHVGSRVAKRCARAGADLLVSDLDVAKREFASQLGARWVEADAALAADVDVLVPCALGGIFDEESVPHLRCRVIAGAANNQLADDRIAGRLAGRGILWAPDFVVNAGGLINISTEFARGGYSPADARRRVRGIGATLGAVFDLAEAEGVTPLAAAIELANRQLKADGA